MYVVTFASNLTAQPIKSSPRADSPTNTRLFADPDAVGSERALLNGVAAATGAVVAFDLAWRADFGESLAGVERGEIGKEELGAEVLGERGGEEEGKNEEGDKGPHG